MRVRESKRGPHKYVRRGGVCVCMHAYRRVLSNKREMQAIKTAHAGDSPEPCYFPVRIHSSSMAHYIDPLDVTLRQTT